MSYILLLNNQPRKKYSDFENYPFGRIQGHSENIVLLKPMKEILPMHLRTKYYYYLSNKAYKALPFNTKTKSLKQICKLQLLDVEK